MLESRRFWQSPRRAGGWQELPIGVERDDDLPETHRAAAVDLPSACAQYNALILTTRQQSHKGISRKRSPICGRVAPIALLSGCRRHKRGLSHSNRWVTPIALLSGRRHKREFRKSSVSALLGTVHNAGRNSKASRTLARNVKLHLPSRACGTPIAELSVPPMKHNRSYVAGSLAGGDAGGGSGTAMPFFLSGVFTRISFAFCRCSQRATIDARLITDVSSGL